MKENDLSSIANTSGGLHSLDAHVMCMERLDINYRRERAVPTRQNTRQIFVEEINGDRQKPNKGIGDKEQTTTYIYRYSSNRRNKNRIRKQLAGMIYTAAQYMDMPNKEKERKLEWLHAQLRKFHQGKYELPVVHDSNWSRALAIPDNKLLQNFESRIK